MKKQELEFRFEGKQAEADAQELAGFLAQEFPDWPARVSPSQPPPNPAGTRDVATTIVIIALIVAPPVASKMALNSPTASSPGQSSATPAVSGIRSSHSRRTAPPCRWTR